MRIGRALNLGLAVTIAAVAGCGPQYRTFTNYTPPGSESGRQCVAQCLNARQICRQHQGAQVEHCRSEAQQLAAVEYIKRQAQYQLDLQRHQSGQTPQAPDPPGNVQPQYGRCDQQGSRLEGQCTADFDLCYQNCGGAVAYTTHCVANCE